MTKNSPEDTPKKFQSEQIGSFDDLAKTLARRETYFMAAVTLIVGAIAAGFGYGVYDASKRGNEAIQRAEQMVAEITGAARPRSVIEFVGLSGKTDGGVGIVAGLSPTNDYIKTPFMLEFKARFKGKVSGGPGKIVGIEVKLKGNILDFISRDYFGETITSKKELYQDVGQYDPQGDTGVTVAYDGHFQIVYTIRRHFPTCNSALAAFHQLKKDEVSKGRSAFQVRPVFERIEQDPGYRDFEVVNVESDGPDCDAWEIIMAGEAEASDRPEEINPLENQDDEVPAVSPPAPIE